VVGLGVGLDFDLGLGWKRDEHRERSDAMDGPHLSLDETDGWRFQRSRSDGLVGRGAETESGPDAAAAVGAAAPTPNDATAPSPDVGVETRLAVPAHHAAAVVDGAGASAGSFAVVADRVAVA